MEATSLLAKVKGDGASPASKKKSLLPHPRQEETESFLQSDGTEESYAYRNTGSQEPLFTTGGTFSVSTRHKFKHIELHGREVGILLAWYCPSELTAE